MRYQKSTIYKLDQDGVVSYVVGRRTFSTPTDINNNYFISTLPDYKNFMSLSQEIYKDFRKWEKIADLNRDVTLHPLDFNRKYGLKIPKG